MKKKIGEINWTIKNHYEKRPQPKVQRKNSEKNRKYFYAHKGIKKAN